MKKDTLKAFFEKGNVTKLESTHLVIGGAGPSGGGGDSTSQNCATYGSCTSGDIGCCDNDTTKVSDPVDQPCGESRDGTNIVD
jgi:hypothetical protein